MIMIAVKSVEQFFLPVVPAPLVGFLRSIWQWMSRDLENDFTDSARMTTVGQINSWAKIEPDFSDFLYRVDTEKVKIHNILL